MVLTAIAEPLVAHQFALVNRAIWEFLPNVDRNVSQTANALHLCHASTSNVEILVLELVARVLLVLSSTIIRFAHVHLEQRVTHLLLDVVLNLVSSNNKGIKKKIF